MCSFVFLSCQLQKTPEPPFLFDRRLQSGPQPALFLFLFLLWFFPVVTLQGAFKSLWPLPLSPAVPTSMLVPTVSTAKCDALIFFFFVFVLFLCFCFEFFPFLLRLCPEKTSFACFLLFLHTFVYITFTSLFSIVCAKTDRFKRVSKKLF